MVSIPQWGTKIGGMRAWGGEEITLATCSGLEHTTSLLGTRTEVHVLKSEDCLSTEWPNTPGEGEKLSARDDAYVAAASTAHPRPLHLIGVYALRIPITNPCNTPIYYFL